MSTGNTTVNLGCGGYPASLLGVLFIALKLTGHIDWPWIWVLSPFWIGIVLILGIILVPTILLALVALGVAVAEGIDNRRRRF